MKMHEEEKTYLHLFLTSALSWDWCSPSRTGRLTMGGKIFFYALIMRLRYVKLGYDTLSSGQK